MPILLDHFDKSDIHVKPILEFRARYERRLDSDFQPDRGDNRSNLLLRGRVGLQMSRDGLTGRIVYQHATSLNWLPAGNGIAIRSDLLEANVSFKSGGTTYTLGRQRFGLGNRRLIGELEWNNVANSFEGLKVEDRTWTFLLMRTGVLPTPSKGLVLLGVSFKRASNTTALIIKVDDAKGVEQTRYTLSTEGTLKPSAKSALSYQIAVQAGHQDGKNVQAWAANGRYGIDVAPKVEAYSELNVASGGSSNRVNATFDQLYPSAHDRLGLMDTTGWKNIVSATAGVKFKPNATSSLRLSYTWLQLYDKRDAWYGVGGGINSFGATLYRDPTGNSGRDIGQEFSLDYSSTLANGFTMSAGAGVFLPGRFVKSFGGGRSGNQTFGYFMLGWKF
ncbi:MAG: alginate export family protein [Armatimonadetes bacterium]|nr:alginate export family protein [Armatimonadota bacterium]